MLLGCQQVLDSDFNAIANDAEFRAGVTLWLKAWHQVPAGSLPNDERVLAYYARAMPEQWSSIAEHALHGFVLCSDNRFYHPIICEKALEVLADREQRSEKAKNAAAKRWKNKRKPNHARAMPEQYGSSAQALHEQSSSNANITEDNRTGVSSPYSPPPRKRRGGLGERRAAKKSAREIQAQAFFEVANELARERDSRTHHETLEPLRHDG